MTFLTVARQQIAMKQVMQPRPKTINPQPAPSRLRRQGFLETLVLGRAPSVLALLVVPAILGGKNLPAQTHAPQATKPAQQQKAAARPAQPRQPAAEAIAARPPASPAPIWPANQLPNQARVSWDSAASKSKRPIPASTRFCIRSQPTRVLNWKDSPRISVSSAATAPVRGETCS
jgi:hypothetical protein